MISKIAGSLENKVLAKQLFPEFNCNDMRSQGQNKSLMWRQSNPNRPWWGSIPTAATQRKHGCLSFWRQFFQTSLDPPVRISTALTPSIYAPLFPRLLDLQDKKQFCANRTRPKGEVETMSQNKDGVVYTLLSQSTSSETGKLYLHSSPEITICAFERLSLIQHVKGQPRPNQANQLHTG